MPLDPAHPDWSGHWDILSSRASASVHLHRSGAWVIKRFAAGGLRFRLNPPHERIRRAHRFLAGSGLDAPELLICGSPSRASGGCSFVVYRHTDGIGLGSLCTRILPDAAELADWSAPLWGRIGELAGKIHALGWVHGDLQPDNILITPESPPRLVLIDNERTRAPLPWRRARERRRNLAQLLMLPCEYLPQPARAQMLAGYRRLLPCPDALWMQAEARAAQRRAEKYPHGQWLEGDRSDAVWLRRLREALGG
ncbi:MAG: hypothetical protein ISN29_05730 [Gammaproteobacteria bacterium AqS3]|nr:hypothetical protein [Gammaproteobacteria bacterium AqS3]